MKQSANTAKVYILTNPTMPGLVRIEKTKNSRIDDPLDDLYSTGVSVQYECAFSAWVADETKVENTFHRIFGPYRLASKRDFFRIKPEQAIALLELITDKEVKPTPRRAADTVSPGAKGASRKLTAHRSALDFDFLEMGIPEGAILSFFQPPHETVKVFTERMVEFRERVIPLTSATKEIFHDNYLVDPWSYWSYRGRSLNDIYNETYMIPR